jgi:glyceraldehyde 3-phosphate dehydrogenase
MTLRIGINSFGRMGRLVLRAGWNHPDLTWVHINELKGDVATAAHLLAFDSVHGRWPHAVHGEGNQLSIDDQPLSYSASRATCPGPTMGSIWCWSVRGNFACRRPWSPISRAGLRL